MNLGEVTICIFKNALKIKIHSLVCYEILAYFEYILDIFKNTLCIFSIYYHNE
jgi:hypothetical protein